MIDFAPSIACSRDFEPSSHLRRCACRHRRLGKAFEAIRATLPDGAPRSIRPDGQMRIWLDHSVVERSGRENCERNRRAKESAGAISNSTHTSAGSTGATIRTAFCRVSASAPLAFAERLRAWA
jgi:hypothetical protein